MILFPLVLLGILVSMAGEHFIPPVQALHGARVLLMPVLLFYGSVAFSYPLTLILAFVAGLMYDLVMLPFSEGAVEFSPGWSIILFGLLCSIMHGFRPLFLKGRWEVHCIVCGILTTFIPFSQYVFLSFRRESFFFSEEVWWRVLAPGAVALVVSPFVFLLLNLFRSPVETEGGGGGIAPRRRRFAR